MKTILLVAGARPNFVKIAPLMAALAPEHGFDPLLVNTGQHYSDSMSDRFFADLNIPAAAFNLNVGSGSHATQTAEIMRRFEGVLLQVRPDAVLVVGDVNSTLAAALVAKKEHFPVAHVEAGLRSFDRQMPEEINRLVTDAISDWLFATEAAAVANLASEGVPTERVYMVGNVMIDTLVACRHKIDHSSIGEQLGLKRAEYVIATLHRPSNVDDAVRLRKYCAMLATIASEIPVVFPVHPRTKICIDRLGCAEKRHGLKLLDPLGYIEFLALVQGARAVFTDSGGLQEETTYLNVPCFTMRDNTERPVTITSGTNRLVSSDPDVILSYWHAWLHGPPPVRQALPPGWDGSAAVRVRDVLSGELGI